MYIYNKFSLGSDCYIVITMTLAYIIPNSIIQIILLKEYSFYDILDSIILIILLKEYSFLYYILQCKTDYFFFYIEKAE